MFVSKETIDQTSFPRRNWPDLRVGEDTDMVSPTQTQATIWDTDRIQGQLQDDLKTNPPCHPRAVCVPFPKCRILLRMLTRDLHSAPFKVSLTLLDTVEHPSINASVPQTACRRTITKKKDANRQWMPCMNVAMRSTRTKETTQAPPLARNPSYLG